MNDDDKRSIEVWNRVLKTALAMPGARIDRTAFLRKELSKHFSEAVVDQAIAERPAKAGIPTSAIQSIAKSCIGWHRAGVSTVSFAAGVPGGWWMLGTVPTDLTQYFWHVIVILQKLAYLHGWPELTNEGEEIDDETLLVFTVFVGVMFGAGSASKLLSDLAERISKEALKRLPQQALTKWGFFRVARDVAKWIGVKLTKQTFARYAAKAIPFISGVISGGISWISFSVMSRRLRMHLTGMRLARADGSDGTAD